MVTLHLVLKRKWYDMIASGEKKEEYREMKPYWIRRLCASPQFEVQDPPCNVALCQKCFDMSPDWCCYPYERVEFRLGYHKDAPRMTFKVEEVCYGRGKEKWGAPKDKSVFIIRLGDRVE